MKKLIPLLVIIGLIAWRSIYINMDDPEAWPLVWDNYQASESVGSLMKDVFAVFSGKKIKPAILPAKEMDRIVFQWKNDRGEVQTSFQRPVGVKNVKEIRLGDLNYQTEKGLTAEEIQRLKNQPAGN